MLGAVVLIGMAQYGQQYVIQAASMQAAASQQFHQQQPDALAQAAQLELGQNPNALAIRR